MHSALFVATAPSTSTNEWLTFLSDANKNEKINRYAERLSEGVWLVNFQACPAALSFLICSSEIRAISYRLLPLLDAPQWLPAGSDPTSTQGRSGGS